MYYMSLEFLIGRSLDNAILNMELKGVYKDAMRELGFDMERVIDEEVDAALGNGGLGRLAACFMDSLASMDYPAWYAPCALQIFIHCVGVTEFVTRMEFSSSVLLTDTRWSCRITG